MNVSRIIVEGEVLDLYPNERISLNLTLNDLGDVSTRNSSYSNTVKVPKTSKNQKIFEFLGVVGSTSQSPYKKVKCSYLVSGLPIITEGHLKVTRTTEEDYHIVLFDGIIDLDERIAGKKLTDLEYLSSLSHDKNLNNVVASMDNTDGYIYSPAKFVENLPFTGVIYIDESFPFLFVHNLIRAIISEAGYTYSGDIFDDEEFKKEVISLRTGVDADVIDFSQLITNFKQKEVLKDVLIRYGLIIILEGDNVRFISMDSILRGDYGTFDLTEKLISIKDEKYNVNYAQQNLFTYSYNDEDNQDGQAYLTIENENVLPEKLLYKTIYDYNSNTVVGVLSGSLLNFNKFEIPLIEEDEDENNIKYYKPVKTKPALYKVTHTGYDYFITQSRTGTTVYTENNLALIDNNTVNFQYQLDNYYQGISRCLTNYKQLSVEVNLTPIEIHQFDLLKLYYLQQTGYYYYVNKLTYDGSITKLTLTQVNSVYITEQSGITNNGIIITNVTPYVPNPPYSYTYGFITEYEIIGYVPNYLIVQYTQLEGEGGQPTGIVYTNPVDPNLNLNNLGFPFAPANVEQCGWYTIQIIDTENNYTSNIVEDYLVCPEEPELPKVEIFSYFYSQNNYPINVKDLGYRFNDFTPTYATITITPWNTITNQPMNPPTILTSFLDNLPLEEGITHIIEQIQVNSSFGFYKVRVQTNEYWDEKITLL